APPGRAERWGVWGAISGPPIFLVAELRGQVAAVERTQRGERELVLVQELRHEGLHLVVLHAVDGGQHLVEGQERAEVQLVLGQAVHAARGDSSESMRLPLR